MFSGKDTAARICEANWGRLKRPFGLKDFYKGALGGFGEAVLSQNGKSMGKMAKELGHFPEYLETVSETVLEAAEGSCPGRSW